MAADSALTAQPRNINLLQTTKFTFTFPRLPFLRFFCASAILPSITTNAVMQPTPHATVFRHGDHLNYDPLMLTAMCDEDLMTWQETFHWMVGLTSPNSFKEYLLNHDLVSTDFPQSKLYSDGILTFNTNANNPNLRVKFTNCHPTYLGMLSLNNADSAENIPTFDLTFQYDTFTLESI